MLEGRSEIPGVDGVGVPGATEGSFSMHQYHGAQGRHRSSIEIVELVEEGDGGKFWFEARGVE